MIITADGMTVLEWSLYLRDVQAFLLEHPGDLTGDQMRMLVDTAPDLDEQKAAVLRRVFDGVLWQSSWKEAW